MLHLICLICTNTKVQKQQAHFMKGYVSDLFWSVTVSGVLDLSFFYYFFYLQIVN